MKLLRILLILLIPVLCFADVDEWNGISTETGIDEINGLVIDTDIDEWNGIAISAAGGADCSGTASNSS